MATTDATLGAAIDAEKASLAQAVVAQHYAADPSLARYGEAGRALCVRDTEHHLNYLRTALSTQRPEVFIEYAMWVGEVLDARGVPRSDLIGNFEVLATVLGATFGDDAAPALGILTAARAHLVGTPPPGSETESKDRPFAALQEAFQSALLAGERRSASAIILKAVDDGVGVRDLYLHVFQYSQRALGRMWERDQITVAQEHYCTAATQLIMSQLYPLIFSDQRSGRVLVATSVTGDLHEIGVRMVADFFEMAGWKTFYLGANTPAQSVVETLLSQRADLLAISATITAHIDQVVALVQAVRASAAAQRVRIIVGGHPFNQDADLWRRVGADGYASDADEAVALGERLAEARE